MRLGAVVQTMWRMWVNSFEPADGRGEVGGVGQRRHLVAEVGARDDGAGGNPQVQVVGRGGADQGQADGAGGGPRVAGGQRDDGADGAGGGIEDGGHQQRQAVVDHRRHDAGQNPGADDRPDDEQDQHGAHRRGDAALDRALDLRPGLAVGEADEPGDGRAEHQGDLVRAERGLVAEQVHRGAEQGDERDDGDEGLAERRFDG